jgi:hypothetical protein
MAKSSQAFLSVVTECSEYTSDSAAPISGFLSVPRMKGMYVAAAQSFHDVNQLSHCLIIKKKRFFKARSY